MQLGPQVPRKHLLVVGSVAKEVLVFCVKTGRNRIISRPRYVSIGLKREERLSKAVFVAYHEARRDLPVGSKEHRVGVLLVVLAQDGPSVGREVLVPLLAIVVRSYLRWVASNGAIV